MTSKRILTLVREHSNVVRLLRGSRDGHHSVNTYLRVLKHGGIGDWYQRIEEQCAKLDDPLSTQILIEEINARWGDLVVEAKARLKAARLELTDAAQDLCDLEAGGLDVGVREAGAST